MPVLQSAGSQSQGPLYFLCQKLSRSKCSLIWPEITIGSAAVERSETVFFSDCCISWLGSTWLVSSVKAPLTSVLSGLTAWAGSSQPLHAAAGGDRAAIVAACSRQTRSQVLAGWESSSNMGKASGRKRLTVVLEAKGKGFTMRDQLSIGCKGLFLGGEFRVFSWQEVARDPLALAGPFLVPRI